MLYALSTQVSTDSVSYADRRPDKETQCALLHSALPISRETTRGEKSGKTFNRFWKKCKNSKAIVDLPDVWWTVAGLYNTVGSSAAVDNAAASRVKVSIKRIAVAVGRRNRRPLREVKVVKDKPKRGMQQLLQRIVPRVRWCAQWCSARAFLDYPLPVTENVTLPQRSLNEQRDERSSPCPMHTFGPWFMILSDDFLFKCRYFLYIFW